MTHSNFHLPKRYLTRCLLASVAGAALLPAAALADTRAQVRVSAGAGAQTNAFLFADEQDTGTLSGTIEVEPTIYFEDERTTFRVAGSFLYEQFDNDFGGQDSYGLSGNGNTRIDERTSLNAGVSFRSSRTRAQDFITNGFSALDDLEVNEFPDTEFVDPTLAGLRARSESVRANAGIQHILSPRDTLAFGINASQSRTGFLGGSDFREAGAVFGWAHRLSPRTSLQANVSAATVDQLDRSVGDGSYITPLIGVTQQLSSTMSLSLQVGATFSSIVIPGGDKQNDTSLAANASLCNRGQRSTFCLNGGRDAQPTNFGGIRTTSTVGATYSTSFYERDNFSVSARYGRASRIGDFEFNPGAAEDSEIYGVSARYRTFLGDRLSAFVSGGYSDTSSDFDIERSPNIQVQLGLSYTFGELF